MKLLKVEEVRQAVSGRWLSPAAAGQIGGVSIDTRTARKGELFVALRGQNFDGHEFLAKAAACGCPAAMVSQDFAVTAELAGLFPGGIIGVADTTAALGDLAAHYRKSIKATVLAVTGSNGKTTTKRMLHHVLSQRKKGSASPKSFNNNVGVPLTLLGVEPDDEYVICEVGSNAPGEIAALTSIVRPDVAVITSVGLTHLEKLIDIEHVAAEKASILGGLREGGVGIILADSKPLAEAVRTYSAKLVRFGSDEKADLRLTGYQADGAGGRYQFNGGRWHTLTVPGRHMASNALAVIAAARELGIEPEAAAEALASYQSQDMRLQQIKLDRITIINDAYNANPSSMAAAGESLADMAARRRVLVAGDMRELGPSGPQLHRDTGKALARCGLDLIVGVGPLGGLIAEGAAGNNGHKTEKFDTVESASAALPAFLQDGDVVLVKGSRGMAMERLVTSLQEAFSSGADGGRK